MTAAASALIPLVLFTINQFILQIFNTSHPDLDLRISYAVQPAIYGLYLFAAIIIIIVINSRLSGLFRYFRKDGDYSKAPDIMSHNSMDPYSDQYRALACRDNLLLRIAEFFDKGRRPLLLESYNKQHFRMYKRCSGGASDQPSIDSCKDQPPNE